MSQNESDDPVYCVSGQKFYTDSRVGEVISRIFPTTLLSSKKAERNSLLCLLKQMMDL